jgi:NOL1/NOP2/fmu family ribosome biogenesis protein
VGLPPGNWFLNSKERKKLLQVLEEQFGIADLPHLVFIQNAKDRVYVINRDIERIPYDDIYIDSLGLYFGSWHLDGFRLSMEGAQLLGAVVKKNIVTLSDEEKVLWLKGLDIPQADVERNDFVLVKHGSDVLGCGKFKKAQDDSHELSLLINYVPKARRLSVVNE